MDKKEIENDWLKPLFGRLPEEDLPASFRENLMRRILKESARRKKRNELTELLTPVVASLGFMGMAAGAILHTGVTRMDWKMPELVTLPFYSYIGVLILLLLGVDYLFRRVYRKRHPA